MGQRFRLPDPTRYSPRPEDPRVRDVQGGGESRQSAAKRRTEARSSPTRGLSEKRFFALGLPRVTPKKRKKLLADSQKNLTVSAHSLFMR